MNIRMHHIMMFLRLIPVLLIPSFLGVARATNPGALAGVVVGVVAGCVTEAEYDDNNEDEIFAFRGWRGVGGSMISDLCAEIVGLCFSVPASRFLSYITSNPSMFAHLALRSFLFACVPLKMKLLLPLLASEDVGVVAETFFVGSLTELVVMGFIRSDLTARELLFLFASIFAAATLYLVSKGVGAAVLDGDGIFMVVEVCSEDAERETLSCVGDESGLLIVRILRTVRAFCLMRCS